MNNATMGRAQVRTTPMSFSEEIANLKLKRRDAFQLNSFGAESDLADASHIRGMLIPLVRRYKTHQSKAYAQAKSLLVDEWHEARLPAVRHTHNKPIEIPWSKMARDLFFAGDTNNTLVLEHVMPVSHLVKNILFPAVTDPDFTDQMFLDLLIKNHSRLSFTVIAKAEDRLIDAKKLRHVHVESDDDWARYKKAGLDTATFMALMEDERFNALTMIVNGSGRDGKFKAVPPLASVLKAH